MACLGSVLVEDSPVVYAELSGVCLNRVANHQQGVLAPIAVTNAVGLSRVLQRSDCLQTAFPS